MPFIPELCLEQTDETPHTKYRSGCVQALDDFYNLLSNSPRTLDAKALADLQSYGKRIYSYYAALSKLTHEACWKLTPKLHLVCHLVDVVAPRWGNPRSYWCYGDEDMIGHMKEVAMSCHPNTMHSVALYKWCLMLSMQ